MPTFHAKFPFKVNFSYEGTKRKQIPIIYSKKNQGEVIFAERHALASHTITLTRRSLICFEIFQYLINYVSS